MSHTKSLFVAVASLAAIVVLLGSIKFLQFSAMAETNLAGPPPITVSSYVVETKAWANYFDTVGTVRSDEGITVSAELSGRVQTIHFQSGDEIKAGEMLLTQDSSNEVAQLKSAEAQLRLAKYNFDQVSRLLSQNTVSENEFETIKQEFDSAEANVLSIQSAFDKKQIRAPFDGVLGIRKVDLGQDLQAGSEIVDLYSHKNLKVDFTVPQTWIQQVKVGNKIEIHMIETPEPIFSGKINAIGSAIDEITRSIEVQAELDLQHDALLPGMAVEVRILSPESQSEITVPVQSIIYAPYGNTVFIVEELENGKIRAKQQFVKIGQRRGDFVSILSGLELGQTIVHAGAFKLFNGQEIAISTLSDGELSFQPEVTDE